MVLTRIARGSSGLAEEFRRCSSHGAATSAACFVLAGLDNTNMRVFDCRRDFDCRREVDIGTGEDLYSCAVDHWLPEPVWRVVNP
jgi:hypothetical protein